jgi:uncharacterized protein (DUF983 family)
MKTLTQDEASCFDCMNLDMPEMRGVVAVCRRCGSENLFNSKLERFVPRFEKSKGCGNWLNRNQYTPVKDRRASVVAVNVERREAGTCGM